MMDLKRIGVGILCLAALLGLCFLIAVTFPYSIYVLFGILVLATAWIIGQFFYPVP